MARLASILATASAYAPLSDEGFWRDLRASVYDGKTGDLPRFEAFCADAQQDGPELTRLPTGQVVERGGHWPGLEARPVWDDAAWMLGLRLRAPEIADELAEVVFERARVRAEGAAWRNGFFYGDSPGFRNFDVFEVCTSASRRRAKSFPATMAALDAAGTPYGPRIVGFGRQRPGGSMLKFHSDKKNYVLTCHVPLDLPCLDDDAPRPDADELAFRRSLAEKVPFPVDGAGLAFAETDDDEPGGLIGHARWHDERGLPQKPSLVDTSFPHSAYSHLPERHAY